MEPLHHVRCSYAKGFVLENGQVSADMSAQRQTLLKALIRGCYLRERLFSSPDMTMARLAKEESVNGSYLMNLINLTYLPPKVVQEILAGRAGPELLLQELMGETLRWWGYN